MATTQRPTESQTRILTALRDAETAFHIRDGAIAPGLASKAQVAALAKRGWTSEEDGVLVLSPEGEQVLTEAERRAAYLEHSRAHGGSSEVRVEKRSRGMNHRAMGGGRAPAGRNVVCWHCYVECKRAKEAGETRVSPDSVVWFTNTSGAAAQRDAEIAAGAHILRHLSGELPTPPRHS